MTIPQEVGTRIRRIRINKDHTQETMAKRLDLTVSAYAKIERGETDPSVSRLFELAKILDVDVVALLKDDWSVAAIGGKESFVSKSEFEAFQTRLLAIEKKLGIKPAGTTPVKKSVVRKIPKR